MVALLGSPSPLNESKRHFPDSLLVLLVGAQHAAPQLDNQRGFLQMLAGLDSHIVKCNLRKNFLATRSNGEGKIQIEVK
jgi:hypothetical protein